MNNTIGYSHLNNNYNNVNNKIVENEKIKSHNNLVQSTNIQEQNSDSIQISNNNKTIINFQKAKDAYKETLSLPEFKIDFNGCTDMSAAFTDMQFFMAQEGINSTFSSPECSFMNFADNLIEFSQKFNSEHPGFLPSNFMDFCQKYKENLTKYGCE